MTVAVSVSRPIPDTNFSSRVGSENRPVVIIKLISDYQRHLIDKTTLVINPLTTLFTTVQCYGLDRSIMGISPIICTMSCICLSSNKGLTDGVQMLADIRIF